MIFRGYENAEWDFRRGIASPAQTERDVLRADLNNILQKCQYLHRNNAICGAISRIMVEYVGATGSTVDVPQNEEQQKFFQKWARNCTVRGDDWIRSRRQRITNIVEDGGVLVLFTQNPDRKSNEIGLKIDLVHGGRVCTPPKYIDGEEKNGIVHYNGIAYNSYGAEVGFWYKTGDSFQYVQKYNDLGLYNAYFERSPDAEKPTSGRTLPLINNVLTQIELLSKIERNMANWCEKVSTQGIIFTTDNPQAVLGGMGLINDDGTYQTESFLDSTVIEGDVRPNQIALAPMGTEAHVISPEGSANFMPIINALQKTISSGVGLVSTILFGDTKGSNFATSKFEAQTFMRKIENWANSINKLDGIIIRQAWAEANLRGLANFDVEELIVFGGSADFEGVDAAKSASAAKARIANGTTTKSFEASKHGQDFDSNARTTIQEMNKLRTLAEENGWTFEQVMGYLNGVVPTMSVEVEDEEEVEDEDD